MPGSPSPAHVHRQNVRVMSSAGVQPTGEDEEQMDHRQVLTWMSRHCRTDTQKVAVLPVPDWDLNTKAASQTICVCVCVCERENVAGDLLCDDVPAFDDLFDGSLLDC